MGFLQLSTEHQFRDVDDLEDELPPWRIAGMGDTLMSPLPADTVPFGTTAHYTPRKPMYRRRRRGKDGARRALPEAPGRQNPVWNPNTTGKIEPLGYDTVPRRVLPADHR